MSGLTLADLRSSAKKRADMEASSFILDSEWNDYVNEGGSELHDLILESDPKSIIVRYDIVTNSTDEFYNLPDDFYKLEAAFRKINNVRYGLDRADYHMVGMGAAAVLSNVIVGGSPYQYSLVGNQLYFLPKPSGVNTVEIWYFPAFTRLVADIDTLNYPVVNGWEQFVILTACIKAKMKERTDVSSELMEKAELKQRIVLMANKRDEWEPPRFFDAYGSTSRNRRYNSYNPYSNLPYRWYR